MVSEGARNFHLLQLLRKRLIVLLLTHAIGVEILLFSYENQHSDKKEMIPGHAFFISRDPW